MGAVLVTGDRGYLGGVLAPLLLSRGHRVQGLDADWFAGCALEPDPAEWPRRTLDVRDVTEGHLGGVESVIHLAAVSNDPLGELDPAPTFAINHRAAVRLAAIAKGCGVRRFVFASSQSLYGAGHPSLELTEDAPQAPRTAYAASKALAERDLLALHSRDFCVTCLRPAILFGAAPRLRCDIVYNSLLASGFVGGVVRVRGNGSEWRPWAHVEDAASAFAAALEAPPAAVAGRCFNVVGGNATVRELAEAASLVLGRAPVELGAASPDTRGYRVDGRRLREELGWRPRHYLDGGGLNLLAWFRRVNFTAEQFRGPQCNRLARVRQLLSEGKLDEELRWTSRP